MYKCSKEEKDYLAHYNINEFERPSVATDIVVFSVMDDKKEENYRKMANKELKVLMIKRANFPYKDAWSLPGGFCRPGEDVIDTAKRELFLQTGIRRSYLSLSGIFGEKDRDPRGWIISDTYMALVDADKYEVRSGPGAWESRWFKICVRLIETRKDVKEDSVVVKTDYEIELFSEEISLTLRERIIEYKEFKEYHESVRYKIVDSDNIAFDHAKILLHSFLKLQSETENDYRIPFDFLGETFSLTQLQQTFELILGRELTTPNFRRKIMPMVIETDTTVGGGHRPAKLFKRNIEAF